MNKLVLSTIVGLGLVAGPGLVTFAQEKEESSAASETLESAGAQSYSSETQAFKDLPWPVQKAMLDRSKTHIAQVQKHTEQGKTVYVAQYEKDNKHHQLRVNQDGTVLSDKVVQGKGGAAATAADFKDLPWPAQKAMLDRSGYASMKNVREITQPDGKTIYVGHYQKENQRHEIRVAEDGTILSDKVTEQK